MLLLVHVVEHPNPISGSEAKFPGCLKEYGPFQGFAIARCDIRFIWQPFLNGRANEGIIFGRDHPQMDTGNRGIDNRERLLRLHGD